jgi:acyl transferase domain-containing protein
VLDDASHYLQSKGLNGNHRTVQRPPQATSSYSTEASVHNIHQLSPEVPGCKPSPKILLWSASSKDSLLHLIKDYGQHFSCHTHEEAELLEDLSFTLNCRRSSLVWKAFLVTSSVSDLISLESGISKAFSSPDSPPNLGFVFSGQGGQWYAMGRELRDYPVFRNSLERSESVLKGIGCSWGLIGKTFLLGGEFEQLQ